MRGGCIAQGIVGSAASKRGAMDRPRRGKMMGKSDPRRAEIFAPPNLPAEAHLSPTARQTLTSLAPGPLTLPLLRAGTLTQALRAISY
jgi:hypothetical protein